MAVAADLVAAVTMEAVLEDIGPVVSADPDPTDPIIRLWAVAGDGTVPGGITAATAAVDASAAA